MKTIHKYRVSKGVERQAIMLPKDAAILTVQIQDKEPYIWAFVDTNRPLTQRNFLCASTGDPISENPASLKYIGTYQFYQGPQLLVEHLFEVT